MMPRIKIDFGSTTSIGNLSIGDWFLYSGEVYIRLKKTGIGVSHAYQIDRGTMCVFPSTTKVIYIPDDYIHITIKAED